MTFLRGLFSEVPGMSAESPISGIRRPWASECLRETRSSPSVLPLPERTGTSPVSKVALADHYPDTQPLSR